MHSHAHVSHTMPSKRTKQPSVTSPSLSANRNKAISFSTQQIMQMQRMIGNQAVTQLMNSHKSSIQMVKIKNKIPGKYPLDNSSEVLQLSGTSVNLSDGQYNFVVMDGEIRVSVKSGHPVLAGGADVDYAGMLLVKHSELMGWNNHSGHYEPDEGNKSQAGLPVDIFSTWQEWQSDGWPQLRSPLINNLEDRKPLIPRGIPIPISNYRQLDNEESDSESKKNKCCVIL